MVGRASGGTQYSGQCKGCGLVVGLEVASSG